MSLINQVLKDLEQRHASEMAVATDNLDGLALAPPLVPSPAKQKVWWLAFLAALVIAAVAGAFWWWQQHQTQRQAVVVPPAKPMTTQIQEKPVTAVPAATVQSPPAPHRVATVSPSKPLTRQAHHTVRPPTVVTHPRVHKQLHIEKIKQADAGAMEKQMVPLRKEQKAEIAYQAAYDQIQLHNTRRAEQQLRQALAMDPRHARARELLAGLLIKQGRWVETAELMQQGVQVLPANLVFLKLYARTLMQMNRDHQAIELLRSHAPTVAQDPDYFALLAALYQRQQNHLAAANTYSQILKLRPDSGIWWVGLGISLEALGKKQQAQQAYARARKTGSLRGDLARYTDNRLLALDAANYPDN